MKAEPSPGRVIVWAAGTAWYRALSTSQSLNTIAGIPRYKNVTFAGSSGLPREGSLPALRPARRRHCFLGRRGTLWQSQGIGYIGNPKNISTIFTERMRSAAHHG